MGKMLANRTRRGDASRDVGYPTPGGFCNPAHFRAPTRGDEPMFIVRGADSTLRPRISVVPGGSKRYPSGRLFSVIARHALVRRR